ncbi:MAG: hypothetical protein LBC87_05475 [Fibromonadaceae bacterium]|jgi:hypothetical protein|nr:hypothetical protein [Fibromonadaceae bacterium]
MKTLNSKAICLLLVLATQALAQRFTTTEPNVFRMLSETVSYPQYKQIAALGEKNSAYANIMLVGGRDTLLDSYHKEKVGTYNVVKSDSTVLGTVLPFSVPNVFTSNNDTIHDNSPVAVAVLDSFSDNKKTATVIFASLKKLVIMQIAISNTHSISFSVLRDIDMPKPMWEINGTYIVNYPHTHTRRLALLGTSQDGANKVYHLATGNPLSKNGNGRVDFFNITENSWVLLQPNQNGLTSGINGLVFNDNAYFGKDLAVIDNFDKKGGKALAVLLPNSKQFSQSALYIFQMDNDWTPSTKLPVVISGSSKPWLEDSEQEQRCSGLGTANWGDETTHLLVSCMYYVYVGARITTTSVIIKDIVLDTTANISNSFIFSSKKIGFINSNSIYSVFSNPISIKNHKNDLHSISLIARSNTTNSDSCSMATFTVMDADYSKNFSIEAGIQEAIVNIDSLFYKSGTSGFSAKTLFGLAQCSINNSNKDLLCLGSERAIGSWSGIELSSSGNCNSYKACKKKDTIFVYVRSASEAPNTALRIPKNILVPYYGQINLGNVKSLSYFKNPNLQNTKISWNTAGLKLSVLANTPEKGIAITPFSKNEGIDTLVFDLSFPLSVSRYPIYLHIADTAKILDRAIPANPGNDTIWNTAEKRYIALPRLGSKGDVYTYDIVQDSLGNYAEIIGDYLHILKVDIANISLAYTENGQIKYRKITLMPEFNELSPIKTANLQALNLNIVRIKGGLQIKGLNGEFELRAYDFKGREIQREKAYTKGSVFVKLRYNCPQIVQIRFNNEKIFIKIAN